jgi:integrase
MACSDRGNFNTLVRWIDTVAKLGVPGLHFHDLRHTGNLLAAETGVSTRDLMARMGHDDMRAALIYQRATSEADRRIADGPSALVAKRDETDNGMGRPDSLVRVG